MMAEGGMRSGTWIFQAERKNEIKTTLSQNVDGFASQVINKKHHHHHHHQSAFAAYLVYLDYDFVVKILNSKMSSVSNSGTATDDFNQRTAERSLKLLNHSQSLDYDGSSIHEADSQDVYGKIKVIVRVRPLLTTEEKSLKSAPTATSGQMGIASDRQIQLNFDARNKDSKCLEFDHVADGETT
jgi:hypothetical protein